ncbi:hypothetical protein FKP32DRAFT_1608788 [Trametes sanguinea]|nr:hypothetical protein FKP32DRAFT_1608788 [Trametes sanguinea]
MEALTKYRRENEDSGYILNKHGGLLAAAVESLMGKRRHTTFKWVKGHSGHERNEGADRMASLGAEKETPDELDLARAAEGSISGAKLLSMTQKLAYRAIRSTRQREAQHRPSTEKTIREIRNDLATHAGSSPTNENIWKAMAKPYITKECRRFLWRTVHDSYMLGRHWMRPNMAQHLQDRATCKMCGSVESMEHIILDCQEVGSRVCWDLMQSLWSATGEPSPARTWGTVIGAPSIAISAEDGKRKHLVEKRWAILATETAYLIWKLRCERVIQNEGKSFTAAEVENRWYALIDGRLRNDRETTRLSRGKRGKKALAEEEVRGIWEPLIDGAEDLPTNWTTDVGVLVGIRRRAWSPTLRA